MCIPVIKTETNHEHFVKLFFIQFTLLTRHAQHIKAKKEREKPNYYSEFVVLRKKNLSKVNTKQTNKKLATTKGYLTTLCSKAFDVGCIWLTPLGEKKLFTTT